MIFYLGTHRPDWLWKHDHNINWFVSNRTLSKRKNLLPAINEWALDSGGFSEIRLLGRWETTPKEYVAAVKRYKNEIGKLKWAAIQDWMCEDIMLKITGKTIKDHQRLTTMSYLTLRDLAPEINWLPVLQGFELDDYLNHIDQYLKNDVDVTTLKAVGVGSICRRQATLAAQNILLSLSITGVKIHGFGLKITALKNQQVCRSIISADSLAWSFTARKLPPLYGHEVKHKNCANCFDFALLWLNKIRKIIENSMRPMTLDEWLIKST